MTIIDSSRSMSMRRTLMSLCGRGQPALCTARAGSFERARSLPGETRSAQRLRHESQKFRTSLPSNAERAAQKRRRSRSALGIDDGDFVHTPSIGTMRENPAWQHTAGWAICASAGAGRKRGQPLAESDVATEALFKNGRNENRSRRRCRQRG
ncbi:MAG TPA: hypothetical protein VF624_08495, partial [Tepidisphaeraceae bacterium]